MSFSLSVPSPYVCPHTFFSLCCYHLCGRFCGSGLFLSVLFVLDQPVLNLLIQWCFTLRLLIMHVALSDCADVTGLIDLSSRVNCLNMPNAEGLDLCGAGSGVRGLWRGVANPIWLTSQSLRAGKSSRWLSSSTSLSTCTGTLSLH